MAQAAASQSPPPLKRPPPSVAKVPVWDWVGKTKNGETKSGSMEALDDGAVKQRLTQMGIQPTKVKRKAKEFHIRLPGIGGVTSKDLLVFTRQFSVNIDAGLPLVQAL